MSKIILDASAILALLNQEKGFEKVQEVLGSAIVSSVNLAEVVTRLALIGMPVRDIKEVLGLLSLEMVPFDDKQAMLAGLMATETKPLGLSLGDRACLAVGLAYDLPVLTADRNWTSLKTDVRVNTLR